MFRVGITGTGSYLGERTIGNEEFDQYGPAVRKRLDDIGIKTRRWASNNKRLPIMMAVAAQLALEDANLTINDIDGMYVGTNSTDPHLVPSVASRTQRILLAPEMPACDLGVGCSGAMEAIRKGLTELYYRKHVEKTTKPLNVLAFGGDVLENITKTSSPVTRGILADGAGCVVLSVLPETQEDLGIYHVFTRSHGDLSHLIHYTSGYDVNPASGFYMNGREVHKFVMTVTPGMIKELFEQSEIPLSELQNAKIAPHQINADSLGRLPERLMDKLGHAPKLENVYISGAVSQGNTSGASALVALDDLNRSAKLNLGDLLVMPVWGGGMTKGALLMKWNKSEHPARKFDDRDEQERLANMFTERYSEFEKDAEKIRAREFGTS